MNPIRVAIVGCGRISDLHELGYRGREDASISAVCDVRRKSARARAKAWGWNRGILFINRCTARTVDWPPLMLFRDGATHEIPVERFEWHDSFIDCTCHLIQVLHEGGEPVLDGPTGREVLQFTLAAHVSAREGREVRPDQVQP